MEQPTLPLESPGSMIGSIQSHQLSSLGNNNEEASPTDGGKSWGFGILRASFSADSRYYGGIMKADAAKPKSPQSVESQARKAGKNETDMESIRDFEDTEWTPQDSAYGAACPICGWVPKRVRRMIEFSMIAGMVIGFVYLLVTTSIHITNERHKDEPVQNTTTFDSQIASDDDRYVEYQQQNQNNGNYGDDDNMNYATNDDQNNDDYQNRGNDDYYSQNQNGYYYNYNGGQ